MSVGGEPRRSPRGSWISPAQTEGAGERCALSSLLRKVVLWLFVACTLLYVFSAGSNITSGDTYSEIHVTNSLLTHGWFDVPVQEPGKLCAGWGCRGSDGRFYATHGIGNSLFLVPFYALASAAQHLTGAPGCDDPFWQRCVPVHLISWNTGLVSAATVTLLAVFALELGYALSAAAMMSLLYGFATMAWPYARFGFDVSLTGLLLLAMAREAWWAGSAGRPAAASWLRAGIYAGLALLVRWPSAAAIAPIVAFCLLGRGPAPLRARLRDALSLGLPILAAACFSGWYNLVRFGGVFDDGHANNNADALAHAPWSGIFGMFISPGKGVIWYCPILLLLIAAFPVFTRRHRPLGFLLLATVLLSLVPYMFVNDWYGGNAWGPRFVMPVLPLACIPLATISSIMSRSALYRAAALVLIPLSIVVQLCGQLVDYSERLRVARVRGYADEIYWDPRHSPVLDHLGTLLTDFGNLGGLAHTVPPAGPLVDTWWLDLWRIHGVPSAPSMLGGAIVGVLALLSWARWFGLARRAGLKNSAACQERFRA